MPTATFKITPAAPGKPEQLSVTDSSAHLAENVGLVRAMQSAGWLAFICGSATVLHVESGESWTVNCTDNTVTRKDPK